MGKEDDTVTEAILDEIGRRGRVIESRLEAAERSVAAAADSIAGIGLTLGLFQESARRMQFQRRIEARNRPSMRVGIFTDTYLPDCNGVTAAVGALARELASIGHHPSIIAPAGSHTFDENFGFTHIYLPAFRHERIPLPLCWSALGWPKSQRIVDSEFDIIHAHGLGPVGVYGARVAHRLNIPLVLTIHTDVLAYVAHYPVTARLATPLKHILLYQVRKLLKPAELQGTRDGHLSEQLLRCFAAASACVIVPTEKTARKFANYIGNARLEICPSGLELPRMEPLGYRCTSRMRAVVRLLYVGRITTEKGIPMLLGSVDDLISRGYNVELTLAGPIIAHSRLSRRLRLLARSGNVRLVGTLSGKDLWDRVPTSRHLRVPIHHRYAGPCPPRGGARRLANCDGGSTVDNSLQAGPQCNTL